MYMPLPSKDKAAHSSFISPEMLPEVQNRNISGPTEKIYVLQKLKKKKNLACEDQSMRYGWCFSGDVGYLHLSEIAVWNNNVSFYRASL